METRPHIIFSVQSLRFAVPAEVVREMFHLPALTPTEEVAATIAGLLDLRGKIVPVMDLQIVFGHSPQPYRLSDKVLVLADRETSVGMIVTDIHGVRMIPISAGEDGQAGIISGAIPPHFLTHRVRLDGEIVMLLNQAALFEAAGTQPCPDESSPPRFWPEATEEEKTILRERARALSHSPTNEEDRDLLAMAVLSLNGEYYGVALTHVQEFAEVRAITPIPCCPPAIVGNMNLRGNILTLIDIREALHIPATAPLSLTKVVVAAGEEPPLGVLVEHIHDVISIKHDDIAALPTAIGAERGKFLTGTAPYADTVVTILDLPKILARQELIVEDYVE